MSKCGKHTLPVATGSIQAAAARNRTDGAAGDRVRRQSAAAYRLPLGRIGLGLAAAVMAAGLAGTPGITASNGAPSAEEWLQALYGLPLYDLPFERTAMQARIWVAPTGDDDAEGSLQAPLRTIQAAIDRAAPGTAILVRAGSYSENVHFWSSGFSDAPIWLTSVDGAGAARIRPAESDKPTIRGYGIANIVVQGFEVSGPSRLTDPTAAIHFTQNSDKLITNLVIIGNIVRNSIDDGIKIAQAERVLIADNTIDGAANGEGIDLVAVNQARVLNNLVTHVAAKGTAAIQVKGGSTDVVVDGNTISHCGKFGVTIGGVTGPEFMWPGTVDRYEASHITISHNYFDNIPKAAVLVQGGVDSLITDNDFTGITYSLGAILIRPSDEMHEPWMNSANITIAGNQVDHAHWLTVEDGQGVGLVVLDNRMQERADQPGSRGRRSP